MRVIFLGSGSFGLPTLAQLQREHEVALVISQPDRPAGRKRRLTGTPVSVFAREQGLDLMTPETPNSQEVIDQVRGLHPGAMVVVAYGHKIGEGLLDICFSMNLHGSLLPKFRGAAPVQRAMMQGEVVTGVSVITLAAKMDGGALLNQKSTTIDPNETAGELHDRLAAMGPECILSVLKDLESGSVKRVEQDESQATQAGKLVKSEGTVSFDQPAGKVRAMVHGLTPWPGCAVDCNSLVLKLLRVKEWEGESEQDAMELAPGTLLMDGRVACNPGWIELLEVQVSGGKPMPYKAFRRGRDLGEGVVLRART